jgi:hypothetical protein
MYLVLLLLPFLGCFPLSCVQGHNGIFINPFKLSDLFKSELKIAESIKKSDPSMLQDDSVIKYILTLIYNLQFNYK